MQQQVQESIHPMRPSDETLLRILQETMLAQYPVTAGFFRHAWKKPTMRTVMSALAEEMMTEAPVIAVLEMVNGETWKENGVVQKEANAPTEEHLASIELVVNTHAQWSTYRLIGEGVDLHLQRELETADGVVAAGEGESAAVMEDYPVAMPIELLADFAHAMTGVKPERDQALDLFEDDEIPTITEKIAYSVRCQLSTRQWQEPQMWDDISKQWTALTPEVVATMMDTSDYGFSGAMVKLAAFLAEMDESNETPEEYRWTFERQQQFSPDKTLDYRILVCKREQVIEA